MQYARTGGVLAIEITESQTNKQLMGRTTTLFNTEFKTEEEQEMLLEFASEAYQWEPSEQTINNILNYSKALEVKPSAMINHIESVLN